MFNELRIGLVNEGKVVLSYTMGDPKDIVLHK